MDKSEEGVEELLLKGTAEIQDVAQVSHIHTITNTPSLMDI